MTNKNQVMIIDGARYPVVEVKNDKSGAVRSVAFEAGSEIDVLYSSRFAAANEPDDGSELLTADDPGALLFHVEQLHNRQPDDDRTKQRELVKAQIITSKEAQQILGIKSSRLSKHVTEGDIQPIKRGIYLKTDIAALYMDRKRLFTK